VNILDVSAFYHDSAAALVRDGEIVAAAQEERFSRRKGDPALPVRAIQFCLGEARIASGDVDHVVFYEKPLVKFERAPARNVSGICAARLRIVPFIDAALESAEASHIRAAILGAWTVIAGPSCRS